MDERTKSEIEAADLVTIIGWLKFGHLFNGIALKRADTFEDTEQNCHGRWYVNQGRII